MIFALFLVSLCPALVNGAPEIQLNSGRVQGLDKQAVDSLKPYYAYYGVPFAAPPVGDLRFRPPVTFQGSDPNDVISSNAFRPACLQPIFEDFDMSEDCLYLNIFSPAASVAPGTQRKVMVYIYGGAFLFGDAFMYSPSRLVTDYDVMVVTIQYRLNVFGFLSTGQGDGNYGLYDQLLALQWVKDNIARFGGDPDDVTIFGESAGAASVSLLSLSPLSKGLFSKGIMQSGVANAFWAVKRDPWTQFEVVARGVGCLPFWYFSAFSHLYLDSIMSCLRSKDTFSLGMAVVDYSFGEGDAGDGGPPSGLSDYNLEKKGFLPVVDGKLLPKMPAVLLADRNYLQQIGTLDRKYVVGCTNNEGLGDLGVFIQVPGYNLSAVTSPDNAEGYVKSVVANRFPYFGVPSYATPVFNYEYTFPRGADGHVDLQTMLNVGTDMQFAVPMVEFSRALVKASPDTHLFMYLFDHYPEVTSPQLGIQGTSHSMDLLYQFDYDVRIDIFKYYANIPAASGADRPLFDVWAGVLTTFAKSGDPSRGQDGAPTTWPRYDVTDEFYMAVSAAPEVRQRVYAKRLSLWTEVIPALASQPRARYWN